ncbi:Transcription termination factor like [Melia azedarach]|uniref:Transcription termination factor like n=1 Tax=Melia azedarach TaxID=155640 RepID=A0ACC1WR10_MELAZ|nr:Transcription termination factor like [Melia azedarach]
MNPFICKTLTSVFFKNSPHLCKPPSPHSISLLFFSSSCSISNGPSEEKTKISLADYLINQQQFSSEAASKASSIQSYLKKPGNAEAVLSFLKESGFSHAHIEKVVKREPNVLFTNLDNNIKFKTAMFENFGFPSADIVHILSADPWIFTGRSENELICSILILKSVVGSIANVSRLLKISGWFLRCDLKKTLIPNIEFLNSCRISTSQIAKYIFHFPRLFLHKPENVKHFVKRVDELGFDRKSKMFLQAIRTMSAMTEQNWELKLKAFRSLGYSEDDILSMFRRSPQAFAMSERKIQGVTEMLLSRGDMDISFIVQNPSLFLCSIEGSLKPRLRVYDILKKAGDGVLLAF